jgi:hypothetical protein
MKVYFDNDGSYGQNAVHIPVIVNEKPIGFVSEVNHECVTCILWDRFVDVEMDVINITKKEQNIYSIRINNT